MKTIFVAALVLVLLPAVHARAEPNAAAVAGVGDMELSRLPAVESSAVSTLLPEHQLAKRVELLQHQLQDVRQRLDHMTRSDVEGEAVGKIAQSEPWGNVTQADYQSGTMSVHRQYWGDASRSGRSGYPTIAWGGFLQLDTGWITQDAASELAFGDIDAKTGLRRVRINVRGEVQPNLSYLIDVDFAASGRPSFRDVMFTAHNLEVIQNLQLGYYQQPFGLDAMTSGRELIFLERLLPFAFDPFRQTGFGCYGNAVEESVTWALSAYRFPTDEFGVSEGESGGWALAIRTTAKLIDNDSGDRMVHAGFNYSIGDPGTNLVRYSIEPGFFVTDPTDSSGSVQTIVDTGDIPAKAFNLFGAELAAQYGPLNFQSEVKGSVVNQINGPTVGFWGAYAQVSWVLTGEVHPYDDYRGTFRRVIPYSDGTVGHPSQGAWEVAAALAYIDLNDKNIAGGTATSATVGINRYLSRYVKFQLNIIRAFSEDATFGDTGTTVVAMRSQAEF